MVISLSLIEHSSRKTLNLSKHEISPIFWYLVVHRSAQHSTAQTQISGHRKHPSNWHTSKLMLVSNFWSVHNIRIRQRLKMKHCVTFQWMRAQFYIFSFFFFSLLHDNRNRWLTGVVHIQPFVFITISHRMCFVYTGAKDCCNTFARNKMPSSVYFWCSC